MASSFLNSLWFFQDKKPPGKSGFHLLSHFYFLDVIATLEIFLLEEHIQLEQSKTFVTTVLAVFFCSSHKGIIWIHLGKTGTLNLKCFFLVIQWDLKKNQPKEVICDGL